MTRYDDHPDHPLRGVPQQVLDAAREALRQGTITNDVEPTQVDPLADSVVMSTLPAIRQHVDAPMLRGLFQAEKAGQLINQGRIRLLVELADKWGVEL